MDGADVPHVQARPPRRASRSRPGDSERHQARVSQAERHAERRTAHRRQVVAIQQHRLLVSLAFPRQPAGERARYSTHWRAAQRRRTGRRHEEVTPPRARSGKGALQRRHPAEVLNATVVELALDSIISIDHEGRVIEFNPAAERTFGYKRADVIGKLMAELIIPPAFRQQHYAGMRRY